MKPSTMAQTYACPTHRCLVMTNRADAAAKVTSHPVCWDEDFAVVWADQVTDRRNAAADQVVEVVTRVRR